MNRTKILRDLEYISGGLTTFKHLIKSDKSGHGEQYYELFQDWYDILYNVIDQIAKENDDA